MAFEAGTVVARLKLVSSEFVRGVRDAERETEDLRATLERTSQAFTRVAATAGAAFLGLAAGIGFAARKGAEFDDAITNVGSITRATAQEIADLEGIAVKAGEATVFSATEAADAMFNLASQGVKGKESFEDLLGPILDASAALRRDVPSTSALTLAAIKSFGLGFDDARRVVNVFSAANEASTLNLERLTAGLKTAGPTSNRFGISLEKTVAVLGTLTDRGLQAEEAGTAFRNILERLNKTTPKSKKILDKVGLSTEKLAKLLPDPIRLFDELSKVTLTNAEVSEVFGIRAASAASILIKNSESVATLTEKITGTSSASEIAERQLKSFGNQMKLLFSRTESLQIAIFRALEPALRKLIATVAAVVEGFTAFVRENPRLVKTILLVSLAVTGTITVVAGLAAGLVSLAITMASLKVVMAGVTASFGPFGKNMLKSIARTILLRTKVVALRAGLLLLKGGAIAAAAAFGFFIGKGINALLEKIPAVKRAFERLAVAGGKLINKLTGAEVRSASERLGELATKTETLKDALVRAKDAGIDQAVILKFAKKELEKQGLATGRLSDSTLNLEQIMVLLDTRLKAVTGDTKGVQKAWAGATAEGAVFAKQIKAFFGAATEGGEDVVPPGIKATVEGLRKLQALKMEFFLQDQERLQQEIIQQRLKTDKAIENARKLLEEKKITETEFNAFKDQAEQAFMDRKAAREREAADRAQQERLKQVAFLTQAINFQQRLGKLVNDVVDGTKTLGQAMGDFIKQLALAVVKATILQGLLVLIKAIAGPGISKFLGLSKGGVIGAQKGLLPRGEDMLIGVRKGESVLTQNATQAIGGARGVNALNRGGAASAAGGSTMSVNISIDAPLGVTEEQIDRMREVLSQARLQQSGGF